MQTSTGRPSGLDPTGTAEIVEIKRPEIVDTGRLRLVGFPEKRFNLPVATLPLEVQTFEHATALSLPGVGKGNHNVGAAYDRAGRLITETQRAKPGRRWSPSPLEIPTSDRDPLRLEGRTFYAGRSASHFGHILLETLTRFWPDVDYSSYDHFLAIPNHGDSSDSGGNSLFGKLVRTANLPFDKFVVVGDQRLECESLDVPSAPFHVAAAADPRFLDVFERVGASVERRRYQGTPSEFPERIYLSRSRLKAKPRSADKRSASNETDIEDMLAREGFQTVHPQELPLHQQIGMARRAEVIAGCDGSALHLAIFARPGTRMLALDTRRVPNQFLINRARGIDAVHVWAATEEVANRMATWTIDPDRVMAGLDLLLAED